MPSLTSQKESRPTKFSVLFKKFWPNFVVYNSWALTISSLYINIIIVSNIIWAGEEIHVGELGILFGFGTWMMGISGLFFGYLADRINRIKLMTLTMIMFGVGMLINGFSPEGQGSLTFNFFLGCLLFRNLFCGGFWPIILSYTNDSIEEFERSRFFGVINATFQVFQISGMLISTLLFQNQFWREFMWGMGLLYLIGGVMISLKGIEPKRGGAKNQLKAVLFESGIKYQYKLTKKTFKTTILRPTICILFVEGIFISMCFSLVDFLFITYLQSPPHNISPFITTVYLTIFGISGGILGSIGFSKLSDRLANKNFKNRIYLIVFSIVIVFSTYIFLFFIPIQSMTPVQGNDLVFIITTPAFWLLGIGAFIFRSIISIYSINQPPLIQKINLPESQGIISSSSQFLDFIGLGTGPMIAGMILELYNKNYQITVLISMIIGIIGVLFWLLAIKWINKDIETISSILNLRAEEMARINGK